MLFSGSKYFFLAVWIWMSVNLYFDFDISPKSPCFPNLICKNFCKHISDICNCSRPSISIGKIECREWSPEFFTIDQDYNWNSNQETYWINGRNTTIPLAFLERLVPNVILDDGLAPYLLSDDREARYSFKISNFCNNPIKISNHVNLSEIFKNPISPFENQDNVIILKMPNNCLASITGSMGKHSSSLGELNFRSNKLTQIPTFPHSLDVLVTFDMSNNNVDTVSNNDFNNISNLEQLNLSNNNLTSLPNNLLFNLKYLEELDLSYNQISVLPKRFLQKNPYLRKFNIANNMLTRLPEIIFKNSRTLENINLSHNRFTAVTINFERLKSLKMLRLESNNIKIINFRNIEHCKNLKELILTNNQINYVPVDNSRYNLNLNFDISNNKIGALRFPVTWYIKNAATLDMSNNCFDKTYFEGHDSVWNDLKVIKSFKCSNCCLNAIKTDMFLDISSQIDIPFNDIKKLDANSLKEFRHIPRVNLSHNRISRVNLTLFQINYENHTESVLFDLSHNPFKCDCKLNRFIKHLRNPNKNKTKLFTFKTEDNFCSKPIEMRGKSLISINKNLFCEYPQNCPPPCHCYVDDIDNIPFVLIVCSDSNLTSFPTIPNYDSSVAIHLNLTRNQISSLPEQNHPMWSKVTILDLSYNQLKSLQNMPFTSKLSILYVNNNSLTEIDDEIESLSHLAEIKLANNSWKCNCKMSKFLINSLFFHERSVLTCEKDNSMYYFTDIDHICNSFVQGDSLHLLWLLLPIIVLVIIISAIVVVLNTYKSEILYYMFAKGICLRFVCEEDVDADKVYDAFVSYSSEDEDWIADFLVPGLESGIPSYKLCLHNRDWAAGEFISDQIVRSVRNSRRTILVLTDNYFKSGWSRLEFDIAYQQGLKDKVRRLIAVVPNEVPDLSKIDQEFKTFIMLTTYVEAKKPYFWRKLRASMPRTKNIRTPSTKRQSIHLNAAFCEN